MTYEIDIVPMGKPRMTRADKWKKRDCVMRYFAFKDELLLKAKSIGLKTLTPVLKIDFIIPINASHKKDLGKPHQVKFDIDNMIKSVFDIFEYNDSYIYDIHATKYWGEKGKIIITTYESLQNVNGGEDKQGRDRQTSKTNKGKDTTKATRRVRV